MTSRVVPGSARQSPRRGAPGHSASWICRHSAGLQGIRQAPSRNRSLRRLPSSVFPICSISSARSMDRLWNQVFGHVALVRKINLGFDEAPAPRSASAARVLFGREQPLKLTKCADVAALQFRRQSGRASPSTRVRSSLPFSRARRVNSPASASRSPSIQTALQASLRLPRGHRGSAVLQHLRRSHSPEPETAKPAPHR